MPTEVDAAVAEANDYVEQLAELRIPELKQKWPAIHARLQAAGECLQ
jgi:hypothetical protein